MKSKKPHTHTNTHTYKTLQQLELEHVFRKKILCSMIWHTKNASHLSTQSNEGESRRVPDEPPPPPHEHEPKRNAHAHHTPHKSIKIPACCICIPYVRRTYGKSVNAHALVWTTVRLHVFRSSHIAHAHRQQTHTAQTPAAMCSEIDKRARVRRRTSRTRVCRKRVHARIGATGRMMSTARR